MITRRSLMSIAGATISAPFFRSVAYGQSEQVSLKLTHFAAPNQNAHSKLLVPWARTLEKQSGGRIKIDFFPGMGLGGTPAQLYDQVRDGVADIAWTIIGNTPGRFPGIEVFELPFIASWKSTVNAQAVQAFYESNLRNEFKDVHPIGLWAHDAGVVHTNKPVRTVEDLRGLKVRSPTRLAGEALKALGANGIPMPIPQVPEALSQRVIDGCVVPWEVVPALRLQELVRNHTEIPTNPTFYVTTMIVAMNRRRYESLPSDLKQIIDLNSGQAFVTAAGKMWDEQSAIVADQVRKRGNNVLRLTQAETQRWQKATQPVLDNWIKEVKERGIDGGKSIEEARALIKKFEIS